MKKVTLLLLALLMITSLCACGAKSDEPKVRADVPGSDTKAADQADEEDDRYYSNKVYYVGDDLAAGGYVITCTGSEYGMRVIVFESEDAYADFQNAEQFTVGEFTEAVEQHAWADFYLKEDEQAYIGLKEGNVLLLDKGMCEFTFFDPNASETVYSGLYVVGEDIDAMKLDIKCTSRYLAVIVFEDRDTYLDYHHADRFSIGEEADAVEAYAASADYIYEGGKTSVNLREGMILMLQNGTGTATVDSGPVIN